MWVKHSDISVAVATKDKQMKSRRSLKDFLKLLQTYKAINYYDDKSN